MSDGAPPVLWEPPPDVRSTARVGGYLDWLEAGRGLHFDSYDDLWNWSTDDLPGFWSSIWDHFAVEGLPPTDVMPERRMPGARWFAGATLSYPAHALAPALTSTSRWWRDRRPVLR